MGAKCFESKGQNKRKKDDINASLKKSNEGNEGKNKSYLGGGPEKEIIKEKTKIEQKEQNRFNKKKIPEVNLFPKFAEYNSKNDNRKNKVNRQNNINENNTQKRIIKKQHNSLNDSKKLDNDYLKYIKTNINYLNKPDDLVIQKQKGFENTEKNQPNYNNNLLANNNNINNYSNFYNCIENELTKF